MSEINSIANGTFTLGQTSATNFQAGPGIKIDSPSAGTVRIANDETVLWSGDIGYSGATAQLSESPYNFNKIGICWYTNNGAQFPRYFEVDLEKVNSEQAYSFGNATMETDHFKGICCSVNTSNVLQIVQCMEKNMTSNAAALTNQNYRIFKVYGINRISGGNV